MDDRGPDPGDDFDLDLRSGELPAQPPPNESSGESCEETCVAQTEGGDPCVAGTDVAGTGVAGTDVVGTGVDTTDVAAGCDPTTVVVYESMQVTECGYTCPLDDCYERPVE